MPRNSLDLLQRGTLEILSLVVKCCDCMFNRPLTEMASAFYCDRDLACGTQITLSLDHAMFTTCG